MDKTLKGKRIRLICCNDTYTRLPHGLEGTVEFEDDAGTLFVKWDNGSTLGLCRDAGDRWEML